MWAVPLFAFATLSLWFLDRPGPVYRWRIACLSAVTSAAVGLLLSQGITHLWTRERPFVSHPHETLLLAPPSHEPSFPSDHAVAAFAIAFSVAFAAGRRPGALFLAGALVIGISRVFVGLHYPGDILGGAFVGFVSALAVFFAGGGRWGPVVRVLSRATDPLAARAWRASDALRDSGRLRPWRSSRGTP